MAFSLGLSFFLASCGSSHQNALTMPSCTPGPTTSDARLTTTPNEAFFAQWQHVQTSMRGTLAAFSLADGHLLGTLHDLPACMNDVSGPFHASDGSFWYVMSTGPRLTAPALAGGGPAPDSCTAAVIRYDPNTKTQKIEWRAPASELIDAPVPSPDGKEIAYLAGGCSTSYFNMHIEVRDLITGKEWAIGANATPCHGMSVPSWSADGSRLLFTFAPSTLSSTSTFVPNGECESPALSEIAVVPAGAPSEISPQELTPAPDGCAYDSAAFDQRGLAALESCGQNELGPLYLVQLNSQFHPLARLPLASSSGYATLAADPTGRRVLVDEHEGEHSQNGKEVGPYDRIELFDGQQMHLITRTNYFSSAISWASF